MSILFLWYIPPYTCGRKQLCCILAVSGVFLHMRSWNYSSIGPYLGSWPRCHHLLAVCGHPQLLFCFPELPQLVSGDWEAWGRCVCPSLQPQTGGLRARPVVMSSWCLWRVGGALHNGVLSWVSFYCGPKCLRSIRDKQALMRTWVMKQQHGSL